MVSFQSTVWDAPRLGQQMALQDLVYLKWHLSILPPVYLLNLKNGDLNLRRLPAQRMTAFMV